MMYENDATVSKAVVEAQRVDKTFSSFLDLETLVRLGGFGGLQFSS